jgi:hypothetical protein
MDDDYIIRSNQSNGQGAVAQVKGSCQSGKAVFFASLYDENDSKLPLALPTFDGMTTGGMKKVNDEPKVAARFDNDMYRNRIVVTHLVSYNTAAMLRQVLSKAASEILVQAGSSRLPNEEFIETTWRVLAEIETSKGPVIIRIPTFEPHIQELLSTCKKQDEAGYPDAPRDQ